MTGLVFFALLLSYAQCDLLTPQLLIPTFAAGCYYRGSFYPLGWFSPSPCERCQCTISGQSFCMIGDCLIRPLCADYVVEKGQCCPTCPNGFTCKAADGHIVKAGETYHMNSYTSCQCDTRQLYSFMAVCTQQDPSIPQ